MDTLRSNSNLISGTLAKSRLLPITSRIPKRLQWQLLIIGLALSDILVIAFAFRLAYFLRFESSLGVFFVDVNPPFFFYQRLMLVLIPVWLVVFAVAGLYNQQNLLGGTREYELVFNATTVGMFTLVAAGFLDPGFIFARGWLLLSWVFAFIFLSLGRFSFRRVGYSLRKHGWFVKNALIVGANNEGISLAEQLIQWESSGLRLLGFIDKKYSPGAQVLGDLKVLGNGDLLDEIVKEQEVEELILASSAISTRDRIVEIFQNYGISGKVNVRMSSGLYEIFTTGLSVKEFASVPLVGLNKVRLTGIDHFFKLLLDYSLTIPGLVLLLPVFVIISVAIKIGSQGPVIYRRRVMGMNGKQFNAYKFRSMTVDSDQILRNNPELKEELAKEHKLKYDPRVTRVGRFLRRSSLDELPQLLNVLKRDMSLIGPRMISPEEMEKYSKWDLNLLTVRPGLTGLWQVSGRSDVSYRERVHLDMYYIRNWNIWLDLQILYRTIPAVIRRRGAY